MWSKKRPTVMRRVKKHKLYSTYAENYGILDNRKTMRYLSVPEIEGE